MAKVNRDTIIEAAIHLFNQNGYHATSMRDIARAIDIQKPSLYHHFNSKEDILLAILESGMDRLISDLEAIVESSLDCRNKLQAAIQAHAQIIADNPAGAAVFMREDRGLGESYLSKYLDKRDHFERLIRQIVQEGTDTGLFRETDIAITVQALLGMVNWMTRWYRPEGRLTAEQIAERFSDLFLFGLLAPADKETS